MKVYQGVQLQIFPDAFSDDRGKRPVLDRDRAVRVILGISGRHDSGVKIGQRFLGAFVKPLPGFVELYAAADAVKKLYLQFILQRADGFAQRGL